MSSAAKLDQTIFARVPKHLKRKLEAEAKRQSAQGRSVKEADITRDALVEYFQLRETGKVAA